jgi:hypothetical protein
MIFTRHILQLATQARCVQSSYVSIALHYYDDEGTRESHVVIYLYWTGCLILAMAVKSCGCCECANVQVIPMEMKCIICQGDLDLNPTIHFALPTYGNR